VKTTSPASATPPKSKRASPSRASARGAAPPSRTKPSTPSPPPISPSDPKALAVQRELASRLLSQRRLIPFTQRINPRYMAGWVHHDIARRLERFSDDVKKGLSPRLMLLMPPRHGKSELASRMFPAWHLGRHPDHEIIACSYNVSLAMTFSRKVKEVLEDPNYQSVFATRLNPNHQSSEEWGVHNDRGGYVAAGVGGGITGKGCNILLIDDPIKNAEEADSPDVRQKLYDWYGSTAYTRLAPGGGVLVIETWWNDDDLAGRLQEAMKGDSDADQFEVVKYPAVAEHDEWLDTSTDEIIREDRGIDPAWSEMQRAVFVATLNQPSLQLLRAKGEALHPERYDIIKLNRIKKALQARHWSALYQQNPVPDDGDYFLKSQFRRNELPAIKVCNVFIAWDFAISEKKQNDYTVGTVCLQDYDDVLHVAEVVRFRSGDAFFIVESILNLSSRWASPNQIIGFEDGQIWRSIETLLRKRMRERKMYPSTAVLKPLTDKLVRARPLQGRMQQGMVAFSALGDWYDTVRSEMLRFPAGLHDDCVDSLSWAAQLALGKEPPRRPTPAKVKSWKDRLATTGVGSLSHMAA
jgi:predicted phage terminase large subunit-like protein